MHASTIALFAAVGASLVSASPVKRQSCTAYPWFIAPSADTTNCSDAVYYQPTSGPETAQPNEQTCVSLSQPGTTPVGFPSVAVNPSACPDQTYTVLLYTTTDCSDQPVAVSTSQCVAAPNAAGFMSFSTRYIITN